MDEYLAYEVSRGRMAGLFDFPPLPSLQVSSFGVIPKQGQVGKGSWIFLPLQVPLSLT